MFQIELGKQCIPKENIFKCSRSCIHCFNHSHPSSSCPKLYCRICKQYGHSATLCIKKASTKFLLEDTNVCNHPSEIREGQRKTD